MFVTELSFTIQFPKFDTPPLKITFEHGIHVIYGESGIGKSLLCRCIVSSGDVPGKKTFTLTRVSLPANPVLVMQNPDDQIVAPTICRDLAFNLENLGWDSERIARNMKRTVERFRFSWDLERHPGTLSGGERELLNFATALSVDPDVIAIDDSMAFLSDSNKRAVLDILNDYCQRSGAVILWITSSVEDLRLGTTAWELCLNKMTQQVDNYRDSDRYYPVGVGRVVLAINNLSFSYDGSRQLFERQNLTVGPFRSLAILGENGSGKSTLGHLLTRMVDARPGTVDLTFEDGKQPRIGFLPQTPERILGGRTFQEILQELIQNGLFKEGNKSLLKDRLRDFQVSWDLVSGRPTHVEKLSIVRVVMVVIMFLAEYDVVILDEPTFSLGANQKRKLMEFFHSFMRKKHLVIISHSAGIANAICDHGVAIRNGEIFETQLEKSSTHA